MNSIPGNPPARDSGAPRQGATPANRRLDLKALRLAVHGWWLGNPLVYKPDNADLGAYTRELASAGAASGTLILGDDIRSAQSAADSRDVVRAVLILRPPVSLLSSTLLGKTAAHTVATVAEESLGCSCAVEDQWDVVRSDDAARDRVCHVSVDVREDTVFLGLRLAFAPLWAAGQRDGETATPLLARSEWREVLLARTLHALDIRLKALSSA
ncbi:MAG: hypothetical protein ACM3N4_00345 [Nitrososphaerota archaeon]